MADHRFLFRGFNPILSFADGGEGFNCKKLINLDGKSIDAPERLWFIGFKAYKYLLFKSGDAPNILLHEKNMTEVLRYVDLTYDELWRNIESGRIIPVDATGWKIDNLADLKVSRYAEKALAIESWYSQIIPEGFFKAFPYIYFAYLIIREIDMLCALDLWHIKDCDVGIEDDIDTAEQLLRVIEKYETIKQLVKLKATKAVTTRHQKNTYEVKEKLREWHRFNRHEFLKPDGSLHQTDAAEHVCYVLKITSLKAKKVAEYMGEFERELKQ